MRRLVRTPWFGDKRVGFGLSPRTWQGWGLTAGFAVLIVATTSAPGPSLGVRGAGRSVAEARVSVALDADSSPRRASRGVRPGAVSPR